MKELRKPESCPECGSGDIKKIVGGIPSDAGWEMIDAGEAVVGDCFMRDWKENWRCSDCGHSWCDKTDPARIELEELYLRVKSKFS